MRNSMCFVQSSHGSLRFLTRHESATTKIRYQSQRGAGKPALPWKRTRAFWHCSIHESDASTNEVAFNKSGNNGGKPSSSDEPNPENNADIDALATKTATPVAMSEKSESPSSDDTTKSKTEKIAEALGQNRETMQAKQDKLFEARRVENRYKYINLTVSTIIAVTIFLSEKLNPRTGINMLRYLQTSSASPEVIGNGRPTLVEFSASWCRTCIDMAPGIYELENDYVGRVNFVVVDGEKAENVDIMEDFGVEGIPQLSLLDGKGSHLTNFIGYVPKSILAEDFDAVLQGKDLPHRGLSTEALLAPNEEE